MRLATFSRKSDPRQPRLGALLGDRMLDLAQYAHRVEGGPALPEGSMKQLLALGKPGLDRVKQLVDRAADAGTKLPAGTPADVVARLNREVNRILMLPDVRERLLELGADPASTTPAQFGEFIRRQNAKWAKFVQEQGIVIEGQ